MIRTGSQYLDSIRDGREVYINGRRVGMCLHMELLDLTWPCQ